MITNIIVVSSLALAAAFVVVWLVRSDVRERVERPKHRFLDRIERYDRQCREEGKTTPR